MGTHAIAAAPLTMTRASACKLAGLALAGAALGLGGCAATKDAGEGERVAVTMYLWDKSMTRLLTPWLEEQFPDIDLTFVVGYNAMNYYRDLNDRGALPDIVTCRRFSLNDASRLSDELLDLGQTELVGSFYSSYIDVNREPDGAVRWLPMCAEVDGIMANLDVFEKYGVAVPTTYAEFAAACDAFEEQGVIGFATDYGADYSCLETMQGSAIPELMSMEGTAWRRAYESESADEQVGLDDKVWPVVFEKYERFLRDTRAERGDGDLDFTTVTGAYGDGTAAMIRATANDCQLINQRIGVNGAMLPYFGETAEDGWLLTYPICQVAVNRAVGASGAKHDAVVRVLEAVFSEEGQRRLAFGATVLSYNKNVEIETSGVLDLVRDCIDANHLYIRLASTEFFSVSLDVAHKMIDGTCTAAEAYCDFDAQISAVPPAGAAETVLDQKEGYTNAFGDHGSPAASSVANTLRAGVGADLAVGYTNLVSAPVFAGAYSAQQLKWLMAPKISAWQGSYTGAEVVRLMEWLVNAGADGANPIHHPNLAPVTSGFEYTMRDNGDGTYTLEGVTVSGAPLDEGAVYTVLLFGDDNFIADPYFCGCPMPEDLAAKREGLKKDGESYGIYACLADAVADQGALLAPSDYVTVLH